jgi:hypothetical protein
MSDTDGYLIEFTPIGAFVKVSAVDPLTGLEVSITGPASAASADLAQLAVRKLERALGIETRVGTPGAPPARRGIVV